MEQNLHETTSWSKTYRKPLFFKDLEVRDFIHLNSFFKAFNESRDHLTPSIF
jgi:hypothetical protein